jgi:hypothetical protein
VLDRPTWNYERAAGRRLGRLHRLYTNAARAFGEHGGVTAEPPLAPYAR